MKKMLKKVTFILMAAVMLFTGVNVLGRETRNPAPMPIWRVAVGGNTYLRRIDVSGPGPVLGSIRQNARIAQVPGVGLEVYQTWTWIGGRASGTNAQMNGMQEANYYISTSQLQVHPNYAHLQSGTVCNIQRGDGTPTSVRVSPYRATDGTIGTNATFRRTGATPRRVGDFTWHLGVIGGASGVNGHNGWNNRLMWVAHTRLPSQCR